MLEQAKVEGKDVTEALNIVNNILDTFDEQVDNATTAVQEYNDALSELLETSGLVTDYQSALNSIGKTYGSNESVKNMLTELTNLNTQFQNGKIDTEKYFENIRTQIDKIDFSEAEKKIKEYQSKLTPKQGPGVENSALTTEEIEEINKQIQDSQSELEGLQAIFAETTSMVASGISELMVNLEEGNISFAEYSDGIKESAENLLALRAEQNDLEFIDGVWKDAAGNVDEYSNSLQNAVDELSGMGDLLTTIGDNYDYIAEHANLAGEAMFTIDDVGTQAYKNLANNMATSLAEMKTTNAEAYKAITDDIFKAMGTSADEVENADTYITEALNGNAQALNAALNASAKQVSLSTSKVTTSMGNVLEKLGTAISDFTYNIEAQGYILGDFGLHRDENGVIDGVKLPTFGYDITGSGGDSVKGLGDSLKTFGEDLKTYSSDKFTYQTLQSKQKPYTSTRGNTTSTGTGDTGRTGGSSSSKKDTSEEDAAKAAEEAYKARLKAFEDYVDEKERLEKRWVDKQKELGQLSNEDYLYITQQRIERYKKYLQEVKNATWLSAEDRLKLEKEYSEKIEDLQVDYLGYLQDQLDDEIEAIEDANEEKIKLIEEEAEAKINALKKVEDARDRDRDKEDYEKERQSILDEISYWEQRTGREAQEALKEAKEKLEELDAEWEDQLEDWSIEDQIQAIEDERDAQISAIEDAQEAEIASIKAVYDAKVKLFAETGEIIYENSVMQSQALYNAYKANFIDPISSELTKLNQASTATAPTTTTTTQKQYETYTIKSGDTLSKIAKKYGTTVDKIMAANPYVTNKNKIYAGKTLQIPKFHEGGIVGGTQEAFALLKPNEVVLKPTWAASLDRMMKHFDNVSAGTTNISNGSNIEVKGDLIKIEANVRNQSDIDLMTKKIERVLKDKFNIKK